MELNHFSLGIQKFPSLPYHCSFPWSCFGTFSVVSYCSLYTFLSSYSVLPYLCVQSVFPNRIICSSVSTHYFLPLLSTRMSSACSSLWNFTPHFKSVPLFGAVYTVNSAKIMFITTMASHPSPAVGQVLWHPRALQVPMDRRFLLPNSHLRMWLWKCCRRC